MILIRDCSARTKLVLLTLVFVSVILAAGIASDIYLGDESFHYRLASYICKADGARPLFDPLALTNPVGKSYYVDPQLWHRGLALFAGIAGGLSGVLAQIYQLFWYILLVGSSYLLGEALRDRRTGVWSAFIAATMPISAALSVILHTDIPVAAVCTLAVYLTVRRRFFLAGVVYALATCVKRNSYLLLPGILLIIVLLAFSGRSPEDRGRKRSILSALTFFILPICIIVLPEVFYRYSTFGIQSFWSGNIRRPEQAFRFLQIKMLPWQQMYLDVSLKPREIFLDEPGTQEDAPVLRATDIAYRVIRQRRHDDQDIDQVSPLLLKDKIVSQVTRNFAYDGQQSFVFYDESNLLMNPWIFIKYFGVVVCLGWVLYFLGRAFVSKDMLLFLPAVLYIPIYVYLFRLGLNARYLSPLIGIMSVVGGIGCATISRRNLRWLMAALCCVQFLAASLATFYFRRIPVGLARAYTAIRNDLPEHARLMCSMNALSLYTGRYSIWLGVPALHELGFLFFNADDAQMEEIFEKYDIQYILVEKDKIYDDSSARHTGGYPASFVEKLKRSAFFETVMENDDALLFRIKRRSKDVL